MSHERECEGEHVPAKHLRAELAIQGQGHFRHSALWVSVTCLIACQGAHLSQFASGKNKHNNNSKKTGSTCLFCSSLMGRRRQRQRQRRSTLGSDPNGGGNFLSLAECRNCVRSLPWAIYQALTDTLSKSSRVANRLHWRPMETSLKMTLAMELASL